MRNPKSTLFAALAVVAGLIVFLRRPVRRPEPDGTWAPLDE